jgi:hypothetical protein
MRMKDFFFLSGLICIIGAFYLKYVRRDPGNGFSYFLIAGLVILLISVFQGIAFQLDKIEILIKETKGILKKNQKEVLDGLEKYKRSNSSAGIVLSVLIFIVGFTVGVQNSTIQKLSTGQETCYDIDGYGQSIACAGTGQDGEFAKDIEERFTDLKNGIIEDKMTGLQWEKKNDDKGIHNLDNVYTWSAAFKNHVKTLNHTCENNRMRSCKSDVDCDDGDCGFSGHRDWRVPNIRELMSIVNFAMPINREGESPIPRLYDIFEANRRSPFTYWSSTTGDTTDKAYFIDFGNGNVGSIIKKADRYFEETNIKTFAGHVRAVRSD